ncbi:hypothetical protein QBC47DRAFT_375402 [Echria macrotheca]|uniref:Uncharacterized protein n=1 Tax=Echria macrotheca TaxID=438768 RepID=A0AAJ0BI08_9PEZI|nr:hypothetical protein QBC47DRAFT_375402 [Echria macrotheca]
MAEQSGVDSLFDVGLASASPSGSREQPAVKKPRRDGADAAHSQHVCHICNRVYERADHLTRHLRSHENARQYSCTRCPKRFNRADLLTRHENTHDRESDGGSRMIRRTDRAVEACSACSAAKAKCEDQKPCSRCKAKDLVCEVPQKKSQKYRTLSDSDQGYQNATGFTLSGEAMALAANFSQASSDRPGPSSIIAGPSEPEFLAGHELAPEPASAAAVGGDMLYFNSMNSVFQNFDFNWDFSFGDLTVPQYSLSPRSSNPSGSSNTGSQSARDTSRRHAAFRRSPWLWEPEDPIDYVQRDTEGLHLDEQEALYHPPPALAHRLGGPIGRLKMTPLARDRLFSIIPPEVQEASGVSALPSVEFLDYLLQASFIYDEYHPSESWIHMATFNPEEVLPELLAAVIANGASFISVPSIWKFGLALQEVVRLRLYVIFEGSNSNIRRLECVQTYAMSLGIGVWSGFKRRMELAEAFLQPLITMLRRGGVFTGSADGPFVPPRETDPLEILEIKWHDFVRKESHKRLAIHVFVYDTQTSITFQTPSLLPLTDLGVTPPVAVDLWRAPSAQAWRAAYLSKAIHPAFVESSNLPRLSETMHCLPLLLDAAFLVDIELCHTVLLHGFWNMVTAYRESVKFYRQDDQSLLGGNQGNATRRLWLDYQQKELYRDLCDVSNHISTRPNPGLALVAELMKLAVYVSFDGLQSLAGKHGEDEAQRVTAVLEASWIPNPDARLAVWHAGQVLRQARIMPPASLRNFNAMAVYFASLTLWAYSLLLYGQAGPDTDDCPGPGPGPGPSHGHGHGILPPRRVPTISSATTLAIVDGNETPETRSFVQLNQGIPCLTGMMYNGGNAAGQPGGGEPEPLTNQATALDVAARILRDNFPVRSEPLPPLVDSLANLLLDLGGGG